ncbi:aminoacyl-tRNA hydrolase [Candidatus Margulisiibacteriota bacterium]
MKLIIGLGNPGEKYINTRHNIGFMVLDTLAETQGPAHHREWQKKHKSLIVKPTGLILAKPQTFMNRSGEAVSSILRYYKLGIEDILLVYDDIDMEFGKLRYKNKGSSGGHNGVKSIADHLGTSEVQRVKIGIGRPPGRMDAATYVLKEFSKQERPELDNIIDQAVKRVTQWIAGI